MATDRAWTLLLVLAGDRVGVWQSPTRRYFVAHLGLLDPHQPPTLLSPHGFSRLPDAIRVAAEVEVGFRDSRHKAMPALAAARSVLWLTQPTQSCINAGPRVQMAVNQAITMLRGAGPVRKGPR